MHGNMKVLHTSYTTLSSGIPWNISWVVFSRYTDEPLLLNECVYQENTSVMWDILWYTYTYITRERCITILYHSIENPVANTINATYARRMMGRLYVILSNIRRPSTAFLYSDWLYFLWHGVKCSTLLALNNTNELVKESLFFDFSLIHLRFFFGSL